MSEPTVELGARWQSERCPECAFDPNGVGAAELPAAVAGLGRRYQAPLTRFLPGEDESILVARPLPGVWSALAYACHVRDVLAVFDGRIARVLRAARGRGGRAESPGRRWAGFQRQSLPGVHSKRASVAFGPGGQTERVTMFKRVLCAAGLAGVLFVAAPTAAFAHDGWRH